MPKVPTSHLLSSLAILALGTAAAQTLTVGIEGDPPRLDPALSTTFIDTQVLNQIFDKLVDIDQSLKIIPGLAKSWDISKDGKTYTFHLASGVKFQDGTPLNAAAVVYTFQRNMTLEGSARKNELGTVKTVTALNPTTVRVELKQAFSPFLAVLTDRAGMVVSPTAAKKLGKNFANNPVGSGPFTFVSHQRGSSITLKANAAYWNGVPKVASLVYRPFDAGDVRYANLISGAVQVITAVSPNDMTKIAKTTGFSVVNASGLGYNGIWFNTTHAPFNNVAARRAVADTIDRLAITKQILENTAVPGVGPFAPGTPAYTPEKVPVPDLKAAQADLQKAGGNLTFTLLIFPGGTGTEVAQALQAMMAPANITVKIEQVEVGTLLGRLDKKDFDAVLAGWSGLADPDSNIYDWVATGGAYNFGGYSNKAVDGLLLKARTGATMAARKTNYQAAMDLVNTDLPYVWLYHSNNIAATSKSVAGLVITPDGILRFKNASLK